jgi:hypothetical protein
MFTRRRNGARARRGKRGTAQFRAPLSLGLCLFAALFLVACKPKDLQLELAPADAPAAHAIIVTHNERVAKLATTYSEGVIEIRWRDERGKHFEGGDLDFWQTTGDRTALRVSKFGDVFLWLGSNEQEYWLFDLLNKDDRVLYRGRHDQQIERMSGLGVKPLALLDLLGLTPIAEETAATSSDQPAPYDSERKAYVIEAPGRGGDGARMRMFFDRNSLLPVRVESIDPDGEIVAESAHSKHETVEMEGVGPMARPKMAEIIDIRRGENLADADSSENAADGEMSGEVKIAINTTTAYAHPALPARYFDLERLVAAMRPGRVEQATASSP